MIRKVSAIGWYFSVAMLLVGCSETKQEVAPVKAEAPKAVVAVPEPAPVVAPPIKTSESTVDKLAKTLAATDKGDGWNALGELRTYIDNNPSAADVGDGAKLLITAALERLVALEDRERAVKPLRTILGADDVLAESVTRHLVVGVKDAATLVAFVKAGGLDALESAQALAQKEGPYKAVAKKAVDVTLASITKGFAATGDWKARVSAVIAAGGDGPWWRCEKARQPDTTPQAVCLGDYYGLKAEASVAGLTDDSLRILRLNHLASGTEPKPSGVFALPVARDGLVTLESKRGATSKQVPLPLIRVGKSGVHLGLRPVVNLSAAGLLAGAPQHNSNVAWSGGVNGDKMLRKSLVEKATALQSAATEAGAGVFGSADASPNAGREKGAWSCVVQVDEGTPAAKVAATVAAMRDAGYGDIRYAREDGNGSVLAAPNHVDVIPAARRGRAETRPLLVHVLGNRVDVFAPKGGEGEALKEGAVVGLPSGAKRWYKGARLFKTSVKGEGVEPVVQTVRAVRYAEAAGTVVLIAAADDVASERVLQIASAIAEAEGPQAQVKLSEVFPGLACKDEAPDALNDGCQSLYPVLFPDVKIPRASGLTDKPAKAEAKVKEKPKEKPKEKAAPKAGFCDKRDLARTLSRRSGAIRFCYNRRLQANHELKGRVVVRMTVGASGRVVSASASGSMPDSKVTKCVLKEMRKLKFRPPEGGQCVIRKAFTFKP
jgi:TonB family protein